MSTVDRAVREGLSPEALQRLDKAVRSKGGQSAVSRDMGISRQGLNGLLKTGKGASARRLLALFDHLGVTEESILEGTADQGQPAGDVVNIPIVEIEAAAGPGRSTAVAPSVVDSLPMPGWLARQLGEVASLQIVTARGDSGEPYISDGDLVMFDRSKPFRAEGMYVIVLDGDLAIKRLQRGGGVMRVLSSNPAYAPVEIPAGEVEDRLRVLGRVAWSGKQW